MLWELGSQCASGFSDSVMSAMLYGARVGALHLSWDRNCGGVRRDPGSTEQAMEEMSSLFVAGTQWVSKQAWLKEDSTSTLAPRDCATGETGRHSGRVQYPQWQPAQKGKMGF